MASYIHKAAAPKKLDDSKKRVALNFKVLPEEFKAIRNIAKRYFRGNVTLLARVACTSFKPARGDLVRKR